MTKSRFLFRGIVYLGLSVGMVIGSNYVKKYTAAISTDIINNYSASQTLIRSSESIDDFLISKNDSLLVELAKIEQKSNSMGISDSLKFISRDLQLIRKLYVESDQMLRTEVKKQINVYSGILDRCLENELIVNKFKSNSESSVMFLIAAMIGYFSVKNFYKYFNNKTYLLHH